MRLHFQRRASAAIEGRADARGLNFGQMRRCEASAIARLPLGVAEVGDWFNVTIDNAARDAWIIEGDCSSIDHLGHRLGDVELTIRGDVGHHVGSMLRGGRIVIEGTAGHYAAERARRGELWISGEVGRFTGAHLIAGTVVIGAGFDAASLAYAARRGTFLHRDIATASEASLYRPYRPDWLRLLCRPAGFDWLAETDRWQRRTGGDSSRLVEWVCPAA